MKEDAIYILQRIKVEGEIYNMFYDGGCKKFCSRHQAVTRLGQRACQLRKGPIPLGGVGGMTMATDEIGRKNV